MKRYLASLVCVGMVAVSALALAQDASPPKPAKQARGASVAPIKTSLAGQLKQLEQDLKTKVTGIEQILTTLRKQGVDKELGSRPMGKALQQLGQAIGHGRGATAEIADQVDYDIGRARVRHSRLKTKAARAIVTKLIERLTALRTRCDDLMKRLELARAEHARLDAVYREVIGEAIMAERSGDLEQAVAMLEDLVGCIEGGLKTVHGALAPKTK